LEIIKKRYPMMPVVVISGHGTVETAVTAIKMGAYDYLEKPFTQEKLIIVLRRACEAAQLKRENFELKSKVPDRTELIGCSSAITKLKSDIDKVAPTYGRVMIHGENGSGKELTARLIHKKSKKTGGRFIIFSPTCMSPARMYQELFGELGNQDANSLSHKRISILEASNNGTLYIDEVQNLSMNVQVRLLKFLQDQVLERPSPAKPIKLDVRFITSTSINLLDAVKTGKFRQDLYYRLNVVPIKVPSLTERKEDIPLLIKYFVKQLSKFSGLKEREFSGETVAVLQAYNWSGNIRQLRNVIEWTLIMNPITSDNETIKPEMLPSEILNHGAVIAKPDTNFDMLSMSLREARELFEQQYLTAQMVRNNYNISRTACAVKMERSALHRKLKLLSIHVTGTQKSLNEELHEELA
jgi:two-component system nitrogen regulation response regulator NtrX